jgi:PTS system mannose-specific IIB component
MKNIILASHGELAKGVQHSLNMISGMGDAVKVLSLREDSDAAEFENEFVQATKDLNGKTLIICDFMGGTPANTALKHMVDNGDVEIISGLSLPVALAAVTLPEDTPAKDILKEGMSNMKVIQGDQLEEQTPQVQPATASQPTTSGVSAAQGFVPDMDVMKGENPVQIVNARIDERLIHGQVAGIWSSSLNTQRFLVVNDEASKDELQRETLRMAAPSTMRLSVLPVKEAVRALESRRYGRQRVFLLFKNVNDVERFLERGGKLETLTVGNISGGKEGEKQLTSSVYVTPEEIATLKQIADKGVTITAQRVPNDPAEDLTKLLGE